MLKFYSKDDYSNEPLRSNDYMINEKTPFNAEPPPQRLVDSFLTPSDIFYIRSHAPVPHIQNINDYQLMVDGFVREPQLYSYKDLASGTKFPIMSHVATIMCAGNRRNEMSKIKKVKGVGWNQAALSTAYWTGIRLRDILIDAGVDIEDGSLHVEFEGLDFHLDRKAYQKNIPTDHRSIPGFKTLAGLEAADSGMAGTGPSSTRPYPVYASPYLGYGSSIPMKKAASPDDCVMLAWEMNGETLSPDHGYPLRAIVPGFIGARSVKWLWRVTVLNHESDNYYQQRDYKVFPPQVDWDTVGQLWDLYPSIQSLEPQAAICSIDQVKCPDKANNGGTNPPITSSYCLNVKGYALSESGTMNVELSLDGGQRWVVPNIFRGPMNIPPNNLPYDDGLLPSKTLSPLNNLTHACFLWEYKAIVTPPCQLVCRASSYPEHKSAIVDKSSTADASTHDYQSMPERVESIWNLRGVMNNAWHRVDFNG